MIHVKRITISKLKQTIDTYILTLPEIKIGYMLAKVEKYIPNHRKCHNCQKYGHVKEVGS